MTIDIEDLVRQGKQIMPRIIILAVLALVGLGAWTAYYTVPSDSVAVVQRFGKYLKDVPPGLHFKLPLGIDTATIVPVKRQLKQEFGFTTPGASDPYQSPRRRDEKGETQMVTGDLNAALVEVHAHLLCRSRNRHVTQSTRMTRSHGHPKDMPVML